MKRIIGLLAAALFPLLALAQAAPADGVRYVKIPKTYRYRVSFTDKKGCGFSVKHPEAFLSPKAIERRKRYGLKVDQHDLPLTRAYVDAVKQQGLRLVNQSKWNNTAVFETADTLRLEAVSKLPFVKGVRRVWISPDSMAVRSFAHRDTLIVQTKGDTLKTYYGAGECQVTMLGVDSLHQLGYRGEGVTIAVIDGGFLNADIVPGLKGVKVLGTRNFVDPARSIYENDQSHGMMVLSCIAANTPNELVGTAPAASFYLLESEDGSSEQLVEEDNWCAAVEYADSLGCDLVTSSLGYFHFDHKEMNHTYRELDGQTAVNSRSASLAASRGILLLNSAGNSGDEPWKKIGFPADGRDMLAVGAVSANKLNTNFSSLGNSADGRVKPDVMAMGRASAVYDIDGRVTRVNGTSFSCPTMAGAAALLVQMYPTKRPTEIIRALHESGDNAAHPDNIFGYGIPDLTKAAQLLKK